MRTGVKIWIGDDEQLRKSVMALLPIDTYGGSSYFDGCTSIYIYNKPKYDIRVGKNDKIYFDEHPNINFTVITYNT